MAANQSTSDEIWYPIPSLPGYEFSSEFRVRSWFVRGRPRTRRRRKTRKTAKILSIYTIGTGYQCFRATRNGKHFDYGIHRVVAELAYGYTSSHQSHTRHFDGDKSNNYASNLATGTARDNLEDARRHGTMCYGERARSAKLTAGQVREMRQKIDGGMSHEEASATYGVGVGSVYEIWSRRTWKHVV